MTVFIVSFLIGIAIGGVRAAFAKVIFLCWAVMIAAVVGPIMLMPGASAPEGIGAAMSVVLLVAAGGAGWIVGRLTQRLRRRVA